MTRKPRRILMTTDAVGGVWTFTSQLAKALVSDGCEVILVTLGPPPSALQRASLADCVTLIESDLKLEWQDPAGIDVDRARSRLAKIERQFAPDIVHLNSFREASFDWNAPVVVVAHSCVNTWAQACGQKAAFGQRRWGVYSRAIRNGLDQADVWIAPSAAFRDTVSQTYQPLNAGRVIWNGIEEAAAIPPAKRPIILGAGRVWDHAKNLTQLAATSASAPWPVQIAGALCSATSRTEAVKGAMYLGELPHEALLQKMQEAEVFVSPALYEPFGLTVLEAARAGCALILSATSTFRELWDGAALFFDPQEHGALAAALQKLCADPGARIRLQRAAAKRSATYSLGRMAAQYQEVYASLMAERVVPSRTHSRVMA